MCGPSVNYMGLPDEQVMNQEAMNQQAMNVPAMNQYDDQPGIAARDGTLLEMSNCPLVFTMSDQLQT